MCYAGKTLNISGQRHSFTIPSLKAVFILSKDTQWADIGLTSEIDYKELFYDLKWTLVKGQDSPAVKRIMRHFQKEVFGEAKQKGVSQPEGRNRQATVSGLEKMMEALMMASDDSQDEEDAAVPVR